MVDFTPIKTGDKVTTNIPIRRKWWQLWKPRVRYERRTFIVKG